MRPGPAAVSWSIHTTILLALAALAVPARAQHAPAFGDSGWIAPAPVGTIEGDFTAAGPRVEGADTEPVGETILRTPFRILFLPLRVLARGVETVAGVAGERAVPHRTFGRKGSSFKVVPTGVFGVRAVHVLDPPHDSQWFIGGSWSLADSRKAAAEYRRGGQSDSWGMAVQASYGLKPTQKYYGIGNSTSEADRSIYLAETGGAGVALRFGPLTRQVRVFGGWQSTSARRGWNDSPGLLDVFLPAEAPGILEHSSLASLGVGGDLAKVDDLRDPSSGVHLRAEARQYLALSGIDDDFRRFHEEVRAYVPVFAPRRVIAVRALHQSVHPANATTTLPFYDLPETIGAGRFAGYGSQRFRDCHLALARVEYRWLIWDRLWALGLAEVGEVAPSAKALRIADVHESYGGGLRYAFNPTAVVRLEIAKGSEGMVTNISLSEDF